MIKRFFVGSIIFLFLSVSAGALSFPSHFVIPPIVEIPSLEDAGLWYPDTDRIEVKSLDNSYSVVHEVGHSIMFPRDFPVCDSFVSDYARESVLFGGVRGLEEDKAESFSFFFFYREQFRSMAADDSCLMLKYRKIYRVFYPRNITKLRLPFFSSCP